VYKAHSAKSKIRTWAHAEMLVVYEPQCSRADSKRFADLTQ
jgi:hypothetical protein